MKLIIVDAGVWVRLARSSFAGPIINRINLYGFLPVLNSYLLSEVHHALLKNNWATCIKVRFQSLAKNYIELVL